MLLPYTTLVYYGKAAAAGIDEVVVDTDVGSKKWQRLNSSDQIIVDTVSRATEVIGQPFTDQVVVDTVSQAKNRSRVNLNDSIGASPSEYDIAQAVWLIQASAINYPGTAGEKLNSAGAAGNPWNDTADYPAGTKGALLKQAADDAEIASIK